MVGGENADIPQKDPELSVQIERALADELHMWGINVVVDENNVYLQGSVRSQDDYARAMKVAHQLSGKRAVIEELVVQSQPNTLT